MKQRYKPAQDLIGMFLSSARRHGPMLFEDWAEQRAATVPKKETPAKAPAMVYVLKVQCLWGMHLQEPCTRVIEMKDNSTLNELHYAIQRAVKFDCDHLFEFNAGRTLRDRKLIFTESDDWETQWDTYDEIALKHIWPLPDKMKLFYWFDFGDDWKFQITKERKMKPPERGVRYPRVIERIGPDPKQYPDLEDF